MFSTVTQKYLGHISMRVKEESSTPFAILELSQELGMPHFIHTAKTKTEM